MTTALLKRATTAAIVATWALAGVAQANPVVVDFESALPLTVVGPLWLETSYTESGATFTPSGSDALVDASFCVLGTESCIRDNSTQYLTALNGAEVTITAQRWFTLNSFDAAFFPQPTGYDYRGIPMRLTLSGTLWNGGTVNATMSLLEDPTNPGDFLFDSYDGLGTAMLRSVTFSACLVTVADCTRDPSKFEFPFQDLGFNDLEFAIDNLSLTIPEPSALWLVALSLGGLAFTRRRSAQ